MQIDDLTIREVFDSRGASTLEATVRTGNRSFSASVPSGKSRGKHEAVVLPFDEARTIFRSELRPQFADHKIKTLAEWDKKLIEFDGTPQKSRLGGNLMLALSIAMARALAQEERVELWHYLREEYFAKEIRPANQPRIFANLINGGAHASNNLDIQEYMVVAKVSQSVTSTVKDLLKIYRELARFFREAKGLKNVPLGDEGGFDVDWKNNFEPIQILEKLIVSLKLGSDYSLGLDVAASSFQKGNYYDFAGKRLMRDELVEVYSEYFSASKLLQSVEDPFGEEDAEGFRLLQERHSDVVVVGDDLTVTSAARIRKQGESRAISGVIIKPNQIGTVSEAAIAIKAAHASGVRAITSHRSGETEDPFIIHLAKAAGTYGVKIGAPARERMAKYNELIRLYDR